jgi:hypothetical protein
VQWNPEGDIRWTRRFDAKGNEFAEAVTTDGHDNVYVTGGARLNGRQDEDMVTVKYDPEGNQVWAHRYDNCVGDDTPKGLTATDDAVYVVGFSRGQGTFYDYVTVAVPNP